MDIKLLKTVRFQRYALAFILTCLMLFIADLSGSKEVIFPEILALAIGAWILEKQPWYCNKRKMFLLVSIASLVGVLIVRYVQVPLIFQILIGYLFTGITLNITRTTLIPIISACILPVYMQTTTWVYPFTVTFLTLIIILLQWLMEKYHLKPKNIYTPCKYDIKEQFKMWAKLLIFLLLLAIIPTQSRNLYLLAPPLIVTFTEFANPDNKARKVPKKIFLILISAAIIGSVIKLVLSSYLHLPLTLCAAAACLIMFAAFDRLKTLFPPAGAILLLPLLLENNSLLFYPLQVAIGSMTIISLSYVLFPKKD